MRVRLVRVRHSPTRWALWLGALLACGSTALAQTPNAAAATEPSAVPSTALGIDKPVRSYLRLGLTQAFWGPNSPCGCSPIALDLSAGARVKDRIEFGLGLGLSEEPLRPYLWGLDVGVWLFDRRLRVAGRSRRHLASRGKRDRFSGERPDVAYAFSQVSVEYYPFTDAGARRRGVDRFVRSLYVAPGYADSHEETTTDDFGFRTLRGVTHRGPTLTIGVGSR